MKGCLLFWLACHSRITECSHIDLVNYKCRSKTMFSLHTLEAWHEFAITIKYAVRSGEKCRIIHLLYIGFHSVPEVCEYILSYLFAVHKYLPTVQCYLLKCCLNKNVKMLRNDNCTIKKMHNKCSVMKHCLFLNRYFEYTDNWGMLTYFFTIVYII